LGRGNQNRQSTQQIQIHTALKFNTPRDCETDQFRGLVDVQLLRDPLAMLFHSPHAQLR
jgi:hypothetical protein